MKNLRKYVISKWIFIFIFLLFFGYLYLIAVPRFDVIIIMVGVPKVEVIEFEQVILQYLFGKCLSTCCVSGTVLGW